MQTTVQPVVQSADYQGGVCTSGCTGAVIRLCGVRGGAGTSTLAAVLALTGAAMVPTELVASEIDQMAALIGVGPPGELPCEISPGLTLATSVSGTAELSIVDDGCVDGSCGDGLVALSGSSRERRIGVLRGPCYLSLRSLLAGGHDLDGLVVVAEPGRALTGRDVADVTGADVVATVDVTPGVARSIDAGLLSARFGHRREFRSLQRWLTLQLDPFPPRPAARTTAAPPTPEMSGTDLPVALCATGGGVGRLRVDQRST